MSDFVRPHRRQPTRLPRSWDSPGKNTGVGWIKELYKKDLHDPDNHDGVITDLEPDILRVWWTLGSITMNKASRGDGIPAVLFQILKDDALKVLHSICQQIWKNSSVATRLEKVSFHSNLKERQCQRMFNCYCCC